MTIVVKHKEGSFKIEGDIPLSLFSYVEKEFGRDSISIFNDDGEELLDPHDLAFYKEAKESESPGKNLKLFRSNLKMTQTDLAKELGTTKGAISNMENGIRPISKRNAKMLASFFKVPISNFV